MTYTIAVVNAKGGVGKSFAATNLAGELALRGFTVGLIDTDSQGNAANYLGIQPENGFFNALVGVQRGEIYDPMPLKDVVRQVPTDSYFAPFSNGQYPTTVGGLYMIPSSVNTHRIPYFVDDADAFTNLVEDFGTQYRLNYIIVDTAPTLSLFDGSIYGAIDGFLYVSECAMGSLLGLNDSVRRVQRLQRSRVRRGQQPGRVLGVVPNKFNRTKEHIDNLRVMGENFPDLVYPPIHLYKTFEKANKFGQTVRAYDSQSNASEQVTVMIERTLTAVSYQGA